MGLVGRVVRSTVGVPARGVKRVAHAATTPMRTHRIKRSGRRK